MEESVNKHVSQNRETLTITVTEGQEYQNRVESIYDSNTFFFKCYNQAANCLDEILRAGEAYRVKYEDDDKYSSDEKTNRRLLGYPNNIIGFCADRGNGKTSAMVSFASALTELSQKSNSEKWGSTFPRAKRALKYQFEVIYSIDPASMLESDSIVTIILSRLFSRFQDCWESRSNYHNSNVATEEREMGKRRAFLQRLQKCFRNMQIQGGLAGDFDDDALERIMELGDYSNMRGALYRLICTFLDFICETEDSYLVLQIDDADLSLGSAFQLIDEIRKKLVMPRVVVLLAANMDQLESMLEQHFIRQYQDSIRQKGMVDVERCHAMAARYMDKAIPGDRQIYLPNLDKEIREKFRMIAVRYLDEGGHNLLDYGQDIRYQEQLLRFLYEHTGVFLLDPESHLHNLLPGNMRELTHFLAYFRALPPRRIGYGDLVEYSINPEKKDLQAVEAWLSNLDWLERYLVEIWAPVNLRTEGHDFLRSLQQYGDGNIHRHILNFLPDYYAKERTQAGIVRGISVFQEEEYREQFIQRCINRGLKNYTPLKDGKLGECEYGTYADTCEALNVLSELPGALRQYKLIYAIRLYCTIHMHQILLRHFKKQHVNEGNEILSFLSDILWRRDEVSNRPVGIHYNHFKLSAKELSKNIKRIVKVSTNDVDPEINATVGRFCRRVEQDRRIVKLQPAEFNKFYMAFQADENIPDQELCFHLYYPLLQDVEVLMQTNGANIERKEQNKFVEKNTIHESLLILINWDVQYMLSRSLMEAADANENKIKAEGDDGGLIFYDVRGAYAGEAMRRVLESIKRVTGEESSEGLFTEFEKRYKAGTVCAQTLCAIQLCVPSLRKRAYVFFRKKAWELLGMLKKLKADGFDPDLPLSTILAPKGGQDSTKDDYGDMRKVLLEFGVLENVLDALIVNENEDEKIDEPIFDLTADKLQEKLEEYNRFFQDNMKDDGSSREKDVM